MIVASPKQALKAGVKLGLIAISQEKLWLDMLRDRNLTGHTYREKLANVIFRRIQKKYFSALDEFVKKT